MMQCNSSQPIKTETWQRVLWKKQPYPDNYIGPDFFRVTKKRLDVTTQQALLGCSAVTQEICSCLLLASVFCGLSSSTLQPTSVMVGTAVYALLDYLRNTPTGESVLRTAVLSVALCGVLCGGVVQSLTASVATDTVYACATMLLVLHVALHDYGHNIAIANETLSHNVGVFACVCLASRLGAGYWHVFSFTVAGIALFARHDTKQGSEVERPLRKAMEVAVVVTVSAVAVWAWVPTLLPLLLVSVTVVNFLLPLLFIRLQHHRQNIYGPWDEARIDGR